MRQPAGPSGQLNRLLAIAQLGIAAGGEDHGQAVKRGKVIWIDLQRAAVFGRRLGRFPVGYQRICQVDVSVGKIGIQPDRFAGVADGL